MAQEVREVREVGGLMEAMVDVEEKVVHVEIVVAGLVGTDKMAEALQEVAGLFVAAVTAEEVEVGEEAVLPEVPGVLVRQEADQEVEALGLAEQIIRRQL